MRRPANRRSRCRRGRVPSTTPFTKGGAARPIHLPSPSFWPLVASFGLPMMAYGIMYTWFLVGGGAIIVTLVGFYGWALEPSVAEG